MAELFPIPFPNLLKRIYHEYERNNSIFDLPARKFYRPSGAVDMSVSFCGMKAANPVGPAAGPQTQLAQNIVLSWLAGSRIPKLKTVQVNDRLQLTRPCIDMATVGYNTEWSQELRLNDSLREYVKASMIIELLKHAYRDSAFAFGEPPVSTPSGLETILDVSVGYDLAGIQSQPIRQWLAAMRDAGDLIEEYRNQIPAEFRNYRDFPFKSELATSITLSTFHGTPADEIERICEFLLAEMDYHVIIKMNPPMLGKERINTLLHEKLGYSDIEVNDKIYEANISFSDAVETVRRLQAVAGHKKKTIGVKFGNTLEVINKGGFLKDRIQYLSGQPLHVLHLALVQEWRKVFGAGFPISFAAGVDAQNFADCVGAGLVPVTTCTDLLRPGGYGRLPQYLLNLEKRMKAVNASTINEFIIATHHASLNSQTPNPKSQILSESILCNTSNLLIRSTEDPRYHALNNKTPPRKIGSLLHLWDCINCDKCIPVCPNDANFYFEIKPVVNQYRNIEINGSDWREFEGGTFVVKESHQIANFADACNDCGNCDVFCPEDGGPYIEKPRFFGSVGTFNSQNPLSGFVLSQEDGRAALRGRFKETVFLLTVDEEKKEYHFSEGDLLIVVEGESNAIKRIDHPGGTARRTVDMRYFLVMKTLLTGMLNSSRVHFVNAGLIET